MSSPQDDAHENSASDPHGDARGAGSREPAPPPALGERGQAAVAALGVRALAGLALPALLQEAAEVVARLLGTELVKVLALDPDGSRARLVAGVGWREGVVGTATVTVGRDSQAGFALLSHAPVVVDDLSTETRLDDPPLLREHGVVSGMSVILYGPGGSAYGVLGAHTTRRRRFTTDDVSFLQGVANILSAAMARQHVEDELRRAHESAEAYATQLEEQALELEQQTEEAQSLSEDLALASEKNQRAADRAKRLLAVSAGLSAAVTPEDVADVIFREGLGALGADAGALAIVHLPGSGAGDAAGAPDGAVLENVRTIGYPAPLAAEFRSFPLTPGRPTSDAVLTRTPRLLGSWSDWLRAYPEPSADMGALGFEAFAAIPVVVGTRVLAVLSASFRRPVTFDEDTRTFLATIGEQCGLALARARAYDAERRARAASAFLAEASAVLATSLDYATTLRAVAEAAVPRLGDWCAVDVVRDPTARTWPPELERVAIVHADPGKLALAAILSARYPTDWRAEGGLAGVLRDGRPLHIPVITEAMLAGAARDAGHLELLRTIRFSSIIAVPLVARGHTLGVVTLCHTESGRHYDEEDLRLAEDLAQRAALAVDNSRLYRDAELARRTAESANAAKGQFLATMSHELRTPLNAIAGHAQLLELGLHGPVTGAQRDALVRIDRAQRHLLGLINDLLNYARIESGRVEYDLQPVEVAEVLRDVWSMVEPQMTAKGLACDIYLAERPDGERLLAWADREKLGQVLLNLLSNAMKFTPAARDGVAGWVTIELSESDADDPVGARALDRVYVRVSDSGVGIPADKLDSVFEPFVQVRSALTRESGGTGLGLAISRDLARGMGGELVVRSTLGAGSTFTLALRRVVSPAGETA